MSSFRSSGRYFRVVTTINRTVRPPAILLAICCCLSAGSAQWLETTIYYGEQEILDSWSRRRVLDMFFPEVVANHLWLPLGATQV
jgi:hypothetical protein